MKFINLKGGVANGYYERIANNRRKDKGLCR